MGVPRRELPLYRGESSWQSDPVIASFRSGGEVRFETRIDEKYGDRGSSRRGRVAEMNAPIITAGNVLGSMKRRRFWACFGVALGGPHTGLMIAPARREFVNIVAGVPVAPPTRID